MRRSRSGCWWTLLAVFVVASAVAGFAAVKAYQYGKRLVAAAGEAFLDTVAVAAALAADPVAVTADGRTVYYSDLGAGAGDLFRLDRDTGATVRLTDTAEAESSPHLSADGAWLYYSRGDLRQAHVWRCAPDGADPVRITSGPFSDALLDVSADGRYLLVRRGPADRAFSGQAAVVALVPVDDPGAAAPLGADGRFSPEGLHVLYDNGGTVWRRPLAGGEPERLAEGELWAVDPAGRRLLVRTFGKDGPSVLLVDLADGTTTPLPGVGRGLFTPDGAALIHRAASDGAAAGMPPLRLRPLPDGDSTDLTDGDGLHNLPLYWTGTPDLLFYRRVDPTGQSVEIRALHWRTGADEPVVRLPQEPASGR